MVVDCCKATRMARGVWSDRFGYTAQYDFFDLDIVSFCILIAVFGVGFAAVTGAAFIWIQTNQPVVCDSYDCNLNGAILGKKGG